MLQVPATLDLGSTAERAKLARAFRQSLPTAGRETAALLRHDIRRLEDPTHQILTGGAPHGTSGSAGPLLSYDEGTSLPPNFVTYMTLGINPDGRGSVLYGVTSIQTDNEYAKIHHSMNYSIGGASYSLTDNSGGWATFWSTQVAIDCPAQITVSGKINSRLEWLRERLPSSGHGNLPATNCGPRIAEEEVVEPGGGCDGASCDENYPTGYTSCVVRYTYYMDTGEIINREILYCY